MTPHLQRSLRKFAKKRSTAPSTGLPVVRTPPRRTRGTVVAVDPGSGTVTVKLPRGTVTARYFVTRAAPVVGQVVEVEIVGKRVLVTGATSGSTGTVPTGTGGTGGDAIPGYWYGLKQTSTAVEPVHDTIYFQRYTGPSMVASKMGTYVSTREVDVTVRFAIYGTKTGKPGTILHTCGVVSPAAAGALTLAAGTTAIEPGNWLAMCRQGTSTSTAFKVYEVYLTAAEYALNLGQAALTDIYDETFCMWKSSAATYTGALPSTPAVTPITVTTAAPAFFVQAA